MTGSLRMIEAFGAGGTLMLGRTWLAATLGVAACVGPAIGQTTPAPAAVHQLDARIARQAGRLAQFSVQCGRPAAIVKELRQLAVSPPGNVQQKKALDDAFEAGLWTDINNPGLNHDTCRMVDETVANLRKNLR